MQNQNSSLTQTMVLMSMPKANMQNQAGSSETAAGAATSTCQSPHSRRRRPHVNSVHFTLPGSFVLCFVTLSLITFGCKVPVRWMSQRLRTAQITRQAPTTAISFLGTAKSWTIDKNRRGRQESKAAEGCAGETATHVCCWVSKKYEKVSACDAVMSSDSKAALQTPSLEVQIFFQMWGLTTCEKGRMLSSPEPNPQERD